MPIDYYGSVFCPKGNLNLMKFRDIWFIDYSRIKAGLREILVKILSVNQLYKTSLSCSNFLETNKPNFSKNEFEISLNFNYFYSQFVTICMFELRKELFVIIREKLEKQFN